MDLMYFLKVLAKRKWLILLIVVLSVGVTFYLTGQQEKIYMAAAKLATGIVDNPEDDGKYMPPQKIEMKFNNLIQHINSKAVVSQLSYSLFLHDLSPNEDAFRNQQALLVQEQFSKEEISAALALAKAKQDSLGTLSYSNPQDKKLIDMLKIMGYDYDALRLALKPIRPKDSDYIHVEFRSEDPELSAFASNKLCSDFIRYYRSDKADRQNSDIKNLSTQQEEKLRIVTEKIAELNRYKLENNIVDLTTQQASIMGQIKEYEMMLASVGTNIPKYQAAIDNIERDQEASQQAVKNAQAQRKRINDLRGEIQYLTDKFISGGSKDQKLKEQIDKVKAELRVAMEQESATSILTDNSDDAKKLKNASEIELIGAQINAGSITQKIQSLRNELAILVAHVPAVSALERDITIAEEEYKEATAKLGLANTEVFKSGGSLKHAEIASAPTEPEPTKQLFYSIFSGMLSLSFCVVLFFVLEYVDVSIKTPAQFERFTNLRLLGYLNQINFISFNLDVNFIDINLESIFHNKNQNAQLEQFKQLIRKIRFEIESTDAKRFLFTSTRPNEGKTFTMISLAYTLSLNNKKVLLIDTNFKNNTLTNMLSAKPSLEKHFNQSLVKEDIITKSKLKGIDVIGCYEGNYSPSEVFSQSNFHNLVNDLAQHYDFIFLEGAALNEYSDSKELISSVEKVISVFSTNAVIKDQDKSSIAYLRGLGDKFMGAILNKVDAANMN